MPTGIRKSNRIRSPAYRKPSVNVRRSRRVDVRVHVLRQPRYYNKTNLPHYVGELAPQFKVMDTQTIGAILEKIRKNIPGKGISLLEKYPELVHGFVIQMVYIRRDDEGTPVDLTNVQIKPSMPRGVKLSTLMPHNRHYSHVVLDIRSVKGAPKNMGKVNPGISYRPEDVFRFHL